MGRVPVADYIQAVEDSRKLAAARKTRQKK
jgi:hypothetical protein